jgi:hypothetical protein
LAAVAALSTSIASMSSIVLRIVLVRSAEDPKQDDKIIVRRVDNNLEATYHDSHSGIRQKLLLTQTGLDAYVRLICKLYKMDSDPVKSLQFDFLGFPSYMITKDTLTKGVINTLQEVSAVVSESVFSDCAEGCYCDMPELVPLSREDKWDSDAWDRNH